ncbi:MAG: aminotransferase class I/II-fold pyridoxal phosphate-dependent enzyme [Acetobacteraceae bacterium]|nr:aminotransferase class I/II-fold pyridoxal phosphate-dependent enzyme [Acetobacteraceae bacterium]
MPSEPLVDPIYQAAVWVFPSLDEVKAVAEGEHPGFMYAREGHPNAEALERAVAGLENAPACLACASGMSAITSGFLAELSAGDHLVSSRDIYGGTIGLITQELSRLGIEATLVDSPDPASFKAALRPNTRVMFAETISNPLIRVADVAALARLAREAGVRLILDNTFASPCLLRPLELGVHAVMHSATKYLSGHSTVIAGVISGDAEFVERARRVATHMGGTLDPFAAWLVLQGMRTLPLRMERHCQNALAVARYLASHPRVRAVHYPGLPGHPEHEVARRQFNGRYGGMLSFEVNGGLEGAEAFVTGARVIRFAPNLGDVSTIMSHPGRTSHRKLPPEERERMGITDGLIRLSVGVEEVDAILADLERALSRVPA